MDTRKGQNGRFDAGEHDISLYRRTKRDAGAMAAVCAIVMGTVFQACGAESPPRPVSPDAWKAIVLNGQKEGRVVLYASPTPPLLARLKADFENAVPGIALEFNRLFDAILISRLDQEKKTGAESADILITTEQRWIEDRAREATLRPAVGPEVTHWPRKYWFSGGVPVIGIDPFVIAYNSNLVKTPITGYKDLLRSDLKGRIAVSEVPASVVAAWYDWLEKTQGADFTAKLAAQQPRIYPGAIPGVQAAAAGEVAVASLAVTSITGPLIQQRAPLKVVFPDPGFGVRYGGVILGWAKRPNAAQVFLNYLMTARGQAAWVGQGDSASPKRNIPGSPNADAIRPYDANAYPADFTKTYSEKWRSLFKK